MNNLRKELYTEITKYIKSRLPEFDEVNHADISFSKLGLDSLGHVELSAVIENSAKLTVEPEVAFNYPTVNSLIDFVCNTLNETDSNVVEAECDKV